MFPDARRVRLSRLDRAAGFLNLLTGRSADVGELNGQALGEFPVAEDLHVVVTTIDQTATAQHFFVDQGTALEVFLEGGDVHAEHFGFVIKVVEAALGQTTVQRHLTTFEANSDRAAGAGFLSFVAFAGGFTVTGAFTATKALDAVLGSGIGR